LAIHPYSARQILQRLRESGYTGGYSILRDLVAQLRPPTHPAFLELQFAPGQCAQIDWGSAGWFPIGSTRRRLSFFVFVLAYSRRLYLEFTLAQSMEHFLACQQRAFAYLGGVPAEMMVDNAKTAVLHHPHGQPATFHPRYLDFAQHYGFQIKACTPRQPQQKGRVESAVAYVRKNFLAGLALPPGLDALNHAARTWLDQVANLRVHAQTRQTPMALFAEEAPKLRPLHPLSYDIAVLLHPRASRQCRVAFDANRYSVPPSYAGQNLVLKAYPDRLLLYDQRDQCIAEHRRCYDRHQALVQPEHEEQLLAQRRQGRDQWLLARFFGLCPEAHPYYQALSERRANPKFHAQKIVALSEHYGPEAVARALADALAFGAFSCEYIANLLEQRARPLREPGALHLTRRQDLLELDLPAPDLSLYQPPPTP
jgi:transposase